MIKIKQGFRWEQERFDRAEYDCGVKVVGVMLHLSGDNRIILGFIDKDREERSVIMTPEDAWKLKVMLETALEEIES